MINIESVIIVTVSGFLLSCSPGPSMMYVLSRSISMGPMAGLASVIGLALGGVILAILTLGLGVFLEKTPEVLWILLVLGGIYLFCLGVLSFKESQVLSIGEVQNLKQIKYRKIVTQGILVELFNPKTILFLLAFIPQFIDTDTEGVRLQMIVYSLLIPITAIPSDIVISYSSGTLVTYFKKSLKGKQVLNIISGVILIGLSLHIFHTIYSDYLVS